ncbi:MAG: FAD-binding protein [Candidatus Tectomicrobia bacterium]|uniref:FAD-binding protein n=1 Tax=Tectimicrobiota bacterium TaxID=2528274 RepID=A0A932GRF5_UNCTE|nr:FAD-binding protein [Candidatus Tectomicrobia bacterium]
MTQARILRVDVAIAGAGGAGIAAAIEAQGQGADVLVLDCADSFGGAAVMSGGGCFIVDTPLQARHGIKDSVEMAYEDWLAWGGETVDKEWARYYIERSRPDLYDWVEGFGIHWTDLKFQEGNRAMRWHRPAGGGKELTTGLYETALRLGVDRWLWRTSPEEILLDKGRVVGVRSRNLDTGEEMEIHCRNLVMATGGFNSNHEMVARYNPQLRNCQFLVCSGPYSTGKGHKLVEQVGGMLTHMDQMWIYVFATPDYRDPEGKWGLVIRDIPGNAWVNAQGKRFHNEALSGGASGTPAVMRQDPPFAWAIIDGPMTANMEISHPDYRRGATAVPEKVAQFLQESPFIYMAQSLEELARAIAVPPEVFCDTIERYNSAVRAGLSHDPEQGKPLAKMTPIATPPFVAIKFMPLARKNFGGVKTSLRCEVLRRDGSIIPGLYAAGELAGMAGGHINGKNGLEGTMLGPSIFSGRVAGVWAVKGQ